MLRAVVILCALLVSVPRGAWAQGNPVGPEFRVNTYTTGDQLLPAVASDSSGNFVVVWQSNLQDGSDVGIFGQRYASSGALLGPEFRANTYTTNAQGFPSVAVGGSGNFVVVWTSLQDGSSYAIVGQRYAGTGAPLGPEFRVNTYTPNAQAYPSVASDASGNFVVAWLSNFQDGAGFGVFGQRYASTGAPLGLEFRINTYTTSNQYDPAVAPDGSGGFVVVWTSTQDGSYDGIFGQRYASSGAPVGPEFRVNTYTFAGQYRPAVAADASGNFVVVWNSALEDGSASGIFGQRYASSGVPLGPQFRVNTYTTSNQYFPSVAADPSGNFVVVWDSVGQDGGSNGIFGQRYASSGVPLGLEFRVNTYTPQPQFRSTVAADSSGNFVVSWQSSLQDGSTIGIFGQRYSMIVPVELLRFGVE